MQHDAPSQRGRTTQKEDDKGLLGLDLVHLSSKKGQGMRGAGRRRPRVRSSRRRSSRPATEIPFDLRIACDLDKIRRANGIDVGPQSEGIDSLSSQKILSELVTDRVSRNLAAIRRDNSVAAQEESEAHLGQSLSGILSQVRLSKDLDKLRAQANASPSLKRALQEQPKIFPQKKEKSPTVRSRIQTRLPYDASFVVRRVNYPGRKLISELPPYPRSSPLDDRVAYAFLRARALFYFPNAYARKLVEQSPCAHGESAPAYFALESSEGKYRYGAHGCAIQAKQEEAPRDSVHYQSYPVLEKNVQVAKFSLPEDEESKEEARENVGESRFNYDQFLETSLREKAQKKGGNGRLTYDQFLENSLREAQRAKEAARAEQRAKELLTLKQARKAAQRKFAMPRPHLQQEQNKAPSKPHAAATAPSSPPKQSHGETKGLQPATAQDTTKSQSEQQALKTASAVLKKSPLTASSSAATSPTGEHQTQKTASSAEVSTSQQATAPHEELTEQGGSAVATSKRQHVEGKGAQTLAPPAQGNPLFGAHLTPSERSDESEKPESAAATKTAHPRHVPSSGATTESLPFRGDTTQHDKFYSGHGGKAAHLGAGESVRGAASSKNAHSRSERMRQKMGGTHEDVTSAENVAKASFMPFSTFAQLLGAISLVFLLVFVGLRAVFVAGY